MSVCKDNISYSVVYEMDTPRSLSYGRARTRGLNVTKYTAEIWQTLSWTSTVVKLGLCRELRRAVRLAVAGRPVALTSKPDL
jgi:hypothetical protein